MRLKTIGWRMKTDGCNQLLYHQFKNENWLMDVINYCIINSRWTNLIIKTTWHTNTYNIWYLNRLILQGKFEKNMRSVPYYQCIFWAFAVKMLNTNPNIFSIPIYHNSPLGKFRPWQHKHHIYNDTCNSV